MEPIANSGNEMNLFPDFLLKEKIMELVEHLNGFTYAEFKRFLLDNRNSAGITIPPSEPSE